MPPSYALLSAFALEETPPNRYGHAIGAPELTWSASAQEDITQDRRGFGAGYLQKHPMRSSREIVGEFDTCHLSPAI